jgi:hypothetical protein
MDFTIPRDWPFAPDPILKPDAFDLMPAAQFLVSVPEKPPCKKPM